MEIICMVFIDRSMTGETYTFAAVPRIGESLQISQRGEPSLLLKVTDVYHVAKGVYPDEEKARVHVNVVSK